MEVNSGFLYRGKFDDFSTTFDKKIDPTYELTLKTNQDIAVLKSKDWFDWYDESIPLLAGATLVFRTASEYRFKSKDIYSSVECTGTITLASQEVKGRKRPDPVAEVAYTTSGPTRGNPVLEYLKRHGKQLDQPVLIENPYTLTSATSPSLINVPKSNLEYSNISGDVNPIHVNPCESFNVNPRIVLIRLQILLTMLVCLTPSLMACGEVQQLEDMSNKSLLKTSRNVSSSSRPTSSE